VSDGGNAVRIRHIRLENRDLIGTWVILDNSSSGVTRLRASPAGLRSRPRSNFYGLGNKKIYSSGAPIEALIPGGLNKICIPPHNPRGLRKCGFVVQRSSSSSMPARAPPHFALPVVGSYALPFLVTISCCAHVYMVLLDVK
jgi:hypothetical protein